MKHQNEVLHLFIFLATIGIISCKKNEIESKASSLATLIVTNAVVGGATVKLNTNERDSSNSYNSKSFSLASGESEIILYPTTGSKLPYYNNKQQTEDGGIYSLFLFGEGASIDAMFMKENIPPYYKDSTIGIRVISLSPNSVPVNITLDSATGTNLFSNITYKQLTNFTKVNLRNSILAGSVTFQVRDASTNDLLASYTLSASANSIYPGISISNSLNRNLTLVIKGLMGTSTGNDAFGLFPVANY